MIALIDQCETSVICLLSEAAVCLETVLAEGQKPANVDIYLMWINIERCRQIIQQLHGTEKDQLYSHVLVNLEQTLNNHTDILQAKIKQLNSNESTGTTSTIADGAKKRKKHQKQFQSQRRSAIEETIIGKGGLMFDDIAGLKDAKQALRRQSLCHYTTPFVYRWNKTLKRILLYGPPGTGKSRLAQAISSEINSTFYCVSSSDLVSSWVGESEKLIKELFHHATNQEGRSVIFIDEIDSICRQRNSREEEHTRRVKTELLKQMEGADNSDSADKIFLLCATNCPWELDTAFLRRFQKRIYIPLPGKEARKVLMKIHTRDNKIDLTDTEWDQLCERTEGYSGSDIANMMLESLFGPIRDLQASTHWKQRQGLSRPLLTDNRDKVGSVYHRYDVRVFVWSNQGSPGLYSLKTETRWVLYITDMMLESLFGPIRALQASTHCKQRQGISRPLFTGNRDKVGSVYHRYDVRVFVWSNQGCPGLYSLETETRWVLFITDMMLESLFGPIRDLQASTHWKQTRWVLFITDMMLESLFGPIRNLQASTHWKQRQGISRPLLTGNRDKVGSVYHRYDVRVFCLVQSGMSRPLFTGNRDKVGSVYHRYDVRVFVWSNLGSPGLYSLETETRWVLYITEMMLESLFGPIRDLQASTHWKQRQGISRPLFTGNRDKVGSVYHRYDVRVFVWSNQGCPGLYSLETETRWVLYITYDVRVFVWSNQGCPGLYSLETETRWVLHITDMMLESFVWSTQGSPGLYSLEARDKVGSVYHRYDVRVFVWSNQGCPGLYLLETDKVGSVYHRYDVRVFVWSNQDVQASTYWKQTRWVLYITDMLLESLFGPIRDLKASTHWKQRQGGFRHDVRVFVWSNPRPLFTGSPGLYLLETETRWVLYITDMMLEFLFGPIRDLQASTYWKQTRWVLYITDMMLESLFGPIRDVQASTYWKQTRWVLYITDMLLESLFGPIRDLQASIHWKQRQGCPGLYSLETDKVGSVYHRYDVRVFVVGPIRDLKAFVWSRDVSLETETRWVQTDDVRVFVWSNQGSPGLYSLETETRWVLYITYMMLESLFGPIRPLSPGLYSLETETLLRWVLYITDMMLESLFGQSGISRPLLTGNRDKVGSVYHRYDVRVFVWSNQGSPGLYLLETDKGVLYITDMMLESLFGPIRDVQASTYWKQTRWVLFITDMLLESLFGPIRDLQASIHWKQRQGGFCISQK
ncbi:VPS4 [Mytilus edulis]|uniref:VPS4 n=1 Tax=Mytilus edulis TaxID=6550 RepID=A0A8S3Q6M7_MYTED|nr:VPS4 [Mytilus edulis]